MPEQQEGTNLSAYQVGDLLKKEDLPAGAGPVTDEQLGALDQASPGDETLPEKVNLEVKQPENEVLQSNTDSKGSKDVSGGAREANDENQGTPASIGLKEKEPLNEELLAQQLKQRDKVKQVPESIAKRPMTPAESFPIPVVVADVAEKVAAATKEKGAKSLTYEEVKQYIDQGKVDVGPNGYIWNETMQHIYVLPHH